MRASLRIPDRQIEVTLHVSEHELRVLRHGAMRARTLLREEETVLSESGGADAARQQGAVMQELAECLTATMGPTLGF